jgi:hypothetical protein
MAIAEIKPITDAQGGLIALGVALALLVLRASLTRPRRIGRARLLVTPPTVLRELGDADREVEEELAAPELNALFESEASDLVPVRHAAQMVRQRSSVGRQRGGWHL